MKYYLIIIMLFCFTLSFSQAKFKTLSLTQTDSVALFSPKSFKNFDWKPKVSFNAISFYSKYDLSIYNPATGFNDNFTLYNGKAEFSNSQYIDHNGIFNNKLDSFNPNA